MAMKISDGLISLVLVCGIVTIFMMILASGSVEYNQTVDNTQYQQFNSTATQISTLADTQYNNLQNLSATSGLDWLGGLFTSAWGSIKLTSTSAGFFVDLASFGVTNIGLNSTQTAIIIGIITTIVIIIVTFILLRIILKEQI